MKKHGKAFGFGGIAALGSGELPAEWILAEHVRLGSSSVILSSRFGRDIALDNADGRQERIKQALAALHNKEAELRKRSADEARRDAERTTEKIISLAKASAAKTPR